MNAVSEALAELRKLRKRQSRTAKKAAAYRRSFRF